MKANNIYSRKISLNEARKNFIIIIKNKLSLFPPVGSNFELAGDDERKKVKLDAYPCICRGPDRPHEHYFIHWDGLKPGNMVEIEKDPEKEKLYHLKIRR
ncbi:MAG: hypothetical protein FJ150_07290 [Euryarchaeota archaeon]|nr:hypothetical protein [Euryarchaeota archaeon]